MKKQQKQAIVAVKNAKVGQASHSPVTVPKQGNMPQPFLHSQVGQTYVAPIRPTSSNNTSGLRKKEKPPLHNPISQMNSGTVIEGFETAMPKGLYAGRAGYGSGAGLDSYVMANQPNPGVNRIEGQRGSLGQVKFQGSLEYRRKS